MPTTYLSLAQAAEYLDSHPKTVRRYVTIGLLPAYRVPGARTTLKFKLADLDALLQPIPTAVAK